MMKREKEIFVNKILYFVLHPVNSWFYLEIIILSHLSLSLSTTLSFPPSHISALSLSVKKLEGCSDGRSKGLQRQG